jgi:predicted RNase H-like HicB family nuclease
MPDYVGVIDESEATWGVRIPDLPRSYGAGASAEDAILDAASAGREWIERQTSSGKAPPKAPTAAELLASGEMDATAGEAAVIIPVLIDEGRRRGRTLPSTQGCFAPSTKPHACAD